MKFIDLTGRKFNRLTVVRYVGKNKSRQSRWDCVCDCGKMHQSTGTHLQYGDVSSCGCQRKNNKSGFIDGRTGSPEYTSYHAAKKRCNPKFKDKWPDYGGRGIEFRFTSFEEFLAEVGPRPEPKFEYSLERIENNGHYEKGNVKWATKKQQARNRRCDRCALLEAKIAELQKRLEEGVSMDGANQSGVDYRLLSEALEESTELLREEIGRLRKTSGVLRSVISQLRNKIEALMKEKDELFLKLAENLANVSESTLD